MVRDEKGFIYPITFCVFTIFILFFLVMVQLYITKKQMTQEIKAMYSQDYYLMSSLKNIEKKRSNEEELPNTGQYIYKHATVSYKITDYSSSVEKIEYSLIAPSNYRIWALSYYDKEQKKMTKWVEVVK
ncbi:MAG: competence type IV pilus minor pilin ComGG [Bacillus sp. (in: firmicutes)]